MLNLLLSSWNSFLSSAEPVKHPNCPAADFILEDVRMKIESVDDVNNVEVNLVFEPEWDKDMMSEEAKLELGFL